MTDKDLMPFGKYQGKPMASIPASYLIWILENKKCWGLVKEYITNNMDVLQKEVKENADYRNKES